METRVFLVDDVIATQALLAELFQVLGGLVLVAAATNEGEAKLWLDEHPGGWDLAVIDLILEAGSGMGVITRCKHANPSAFVVVFSGYVTAALAGHCTSLGADAVFQKNHPGEFVEWIGNHANRGMASTLR